MVIQKSLTLLETGVDKSRSASSSHVSSDNESIDCRTPISSHPEEMVHGGRRVNRKSDESTVEMFNYLSQDGENTFGISSPNMRTQNSRRKENRSRRGERLSAREKKDLGIHLRGKDHLSWAQIADGYRQSYGSRRKNTSISRQAARLGFTLSEGAKRSKIV